jgi:hypothetical protein
MPVHAPSQGFREGGQRGITKIPEESEGSMEVSWFFEFDFDPGPIKCSGKAAA